MIEKQDPRIAVTRHKALMSAIELIKEKGIREVTYQSVSARTGISRSTLYRHWPDINSLLLEAFETVAAPPSSNFSSLGSLKADVEHLIMGLIYALDNTDWGFVAPQLIAAAAIDPKMRKLLQEFILQRLKNSEPIVTAAIESGELDHDTNPTDFLILVVSPVFYRKLMAGLPLDTDWVESHVNALCNLND